MHRSAVRNKSLNSDWYTEGKVRKKGNEREWKERDLRLCGSHPIPSTLRGPLEQTCQLPLEGQSVKVDSAMLLVHTLWWGSMNQCKHSSDCWEAHQRAEWKVFHQGCQRTYCFVEAALLCAGVLKELCLTWSLPMQWPAAGRRCQL